MSQAVDLLTLAVVLVCFVAWVNFFKIASRRWRFEYFTFDFAAGALLIAVLAAFTLGNLGTELGLGDRLLVASKTSQALVFAAGCLLGMGMLTLFAAIRIIGIAFALAIAFSLAALIASSVALTSNNIVVSAIGMALLFAAALIGAKAARGQDAPLLPARNMRQPAGITLRQSSKGILLAFAAGIFLGSTLPVAFTGIGGDFGLGPYAGLLLAFFGMLVTVVLFSFFLLNIGIDLPPGSLSGYWSKSSPTRRQHRFGVLSGLIFAIGSLGYLSVRFPSAEAATTAKPLAPPDVVAAVAFVIASLCGVVFWKESKLTKSPSALLAALLFFACGALCSSLAGNL